ncbi:MAG: hypothetical protein ACP5SI_09885 [Chloroflexia bacterium]
MDGRKVIGTLARRREIEAVLEAMARARTEEDSRRYLEQLAAYGRDVLPVVVHALETPDPWMVRALGRAVAQLEDRSLAIEALRRAVLSPQSTDRQRIVAMVLLDQFLGYPLDDDLFAALGNPAEIAVRGLLRARPEEGAALRLDYLSILHTQPYAEILAAIERFEDTGGERAIEALRFFALDGREGVAGRALEALGRLRSPLALQALLVVAPNVSSERRALVERMYRKLRLSGVEEVPLPPPPEGTRVLLTPLDGAGARLCLVLFPEPGGYRALHLHLDEEDGIQACFEAFLNERDIPPPAAPGTVHAAPPPWHGAFFLESGFAYLQTVLGRLLERNYRRDKPLSVEYRFYCDGIWGWSVPQEQFPKVTPGRPAPSQTEIAGLLAHPYFLSWFAESPAIVEAARRLAYADVSGSVGQAALAVAVISLLQDEFPPARCRTYARRLREMAEWLALAGRNELAAISMAAAEEMDTGLPLRSTFAMTMVQKGLLIALGQFRRERVSR